MVHLCVNHPHEPADFVCHNCADKLCEDCIDEGIINCYCRKPECQQALKNENGSALPLQIDCPNCSSEMELTTHERISKIVRCPSCSAGLDFNSDPPVIHHTKRSARPKELPEDWEKPRLLDLYFAPRSFFSKTISIGQKPFLIMITYLMGISAAVDRVDQNIFGFSHKTVNTNNSLYFAVESWPYFWLLMILMGAIGAVFIWWLGGWWYKKRLQFSGDLYADQYEARYVYIYSSFVYEGPFILVMILYTILYENYLNASLRDNTLLWIPIIFLFLSLYTSYTGATEVFDVVKKKAALWFIIIPGVFFLAIMAAVFLLNSENGDFAGFYSNEIVPEERVIYSPDSSCSIRLPNDWKLMKNLYEDADIQAGNHFREAYCTVFAEPKTSIPENITLDEYFEYASAFLKNLQNPVIRQNTRTISGYTIRTMEIKGEDSGMNFYYSLNVIENQKYFYQMLFWTLAEYEEKNIPVFREVLDSFKPLKIENQLTASENNNGISGDTIPKPSAARPK